MKPDLSTMEPTRTAYIEGWGTTTVGEIRQTEQKPAGPWDLAEEREAVKAIYRELATRNLCRTWPDESSGGSPEERRGSTG